MMRQGRRPSSERRLVQRVGREMMGKLFKWAVAVAVVAGSSAGYAHDFFLLPDQFQPSRTGSVKIAATVGSSFPTPEAVVAADRVERRTFPSVAARMRSHGSYLPVASRPAKASSD